MRNSVTFRVHGDNAAEIQTKAAVELDEYGAPMTAIVEIDSRATQLMTGKVVGYLADVTATWSDDDIDPEPG